MTSGPPRTGRIRTVAALLVAVVAAMVVAVVAAGPAAAHAELASSEPASGARLASSPDELLLEFTESVTVVDGGIRLLDGAGAVVPTGEARADGRTVTVALDGPLQEGGYVLAWRVLSADSHPVTGSLPFAIGDAEPAAVAAGGGDATGAKALLVAARWLGYAGLALLVGPLLLVLVCWPAGWSDPRPGRLVLAGAGIVMVGTVTGLLAQGPYVAGRPVSRFADTTLISGTFQSTYGQAAVARVLGVLALLLVLDAVRQRRTMPRNAGAAVAAAVVVVTYPAQGHAAGAESYVAAMANDALHLAAMAAWVGGLVLLGSGLLRTDGTTEVTEVLPRWSRLAMTAVGALVVTGVLQSLREVGSVDALGSTTYGRLLLAKLVLVTGLVALGDVGRRWVRRTYGVAVVHAYSDGDPVEERRGDLRTLRASVAVEIALAAVVLAVTAVLVATTPARVEAGPAGSTPASTSPSRDTIRLPGGARVTVSVTAGRVVTITVDGPDGRPLDAQSVTAAATAAARRIEKLPLSLSRRAVGTYRAAETLPYAGEWRVTVRVQTSPTEAGVGTAVVGVP